MNTPMSPDEGWSHVLHMVGETVVDKDNRRIGTVDVIAAAEDSLPVPEWLVVKTSLFGRRRLVPIVSVREEERTLHVPFAREAVMMAPVPHIPETLHHSEREALARHYAQAA
jgi:hypothetical protein